MEGRMFGWMDGSKALLKELPLERLKKKLTNKSLKFSLITVNCNKVKKTMNKLNKKKSTGIDVTSFVFYVT